MLSFLPSVRLVILGLALGSLGACSSTPTDEPETPAEPLYLKASDLMDKGENKKAAKVFEDIERQHPYSPWAKRAQIMAAYAQYQALDYDDAIVTLNAFLQLHPGHKDVAYALYLRALCFYERIEDVRRDPTWAREALQALSDVITRFPDTPYAQDAHIKISLIHDHLAGAEMDVGRQYLKRSIYTAAILRFRHVVEEYPTTSHTPEALHRLVECDLALGLPREAQEAGAVLGHNFPGSDWYEDSYRLLTTKGLQPAAPSRDSWLSHLGL